MPIEFENDKIINYTDHRKYRTKPSMMTNFLIRLGVVKDTSSAQKFFAWVIAICFAISAYILVVYVFGYNFNQQKPVDYKNMTSEQQAKLSPLMQKILRKQ